MAIENSGHGRASRLRSDAVAYRCSDRKKKKRERSVRVEGRTWVFGDNINTDLMWPGTAFRATDEERRKLVFSANRPGWSSEVRQGDLIVGGGNFGTGSSRPAPRLLRELGVAGLVAESIAGLFFRNSVNFALPVMECPGVTKLVEEGDALSVDFATGVVRNTRTGQELKGEPLPPFLLEIVDAGGVKARLIRDGFVDPD
ncbi:MAG: 3-isopropylmalate dehydratase [Chloroflexi bacterium]|nr:3-isopropylmalate dehydratase [Chloroflexota bacterium]